MGGAISLGGLRMPPYIVSLFILIACYLLSHLVIYIIRKADNLAAKTKTTLDDHLFAASKKPIRIVFFLLGLHLALYYYNADLKVGSIALGTAFTIVWILVGAYIISKIIKTIFHWYTKEIAHKTKTDIDDTLFPFVRKVTNIGIYIIAFLVVFDKLGIQIGPMLAGLGIAGLAVALALQDTLSNFFSAVYMAIDRPIKIGDYIEIDGDIKGFVEEIGWRSTKIRKLGNNVVIIPNAKLSQTTLTNYNTPKPEMSLIVPVGVSYSSNLEKVERVTVAVAKKVLKQTKGAVKEFTPFIRYNEFAASSVNFSVILRVQAYVDQYLVRHEFIKALHKSYKKEGIEIPFPQHDIHIKGKV